jgi:hypothetical protein
MVSLSRCFSVAVAALAVSSLATSGLGASAPPLDQPIAGVDLASIPSVVVHRTDGLGRATENYYPEVAYSGQIGGFAVIDCRVSAKGELDACAIVAEWPSHCFFGAAAEKMAARRAISASPAVVSEHPSGSDVVRQKVVFDMFRLRPNARC